MKLFSVVLMDSDYREDISGQLTYRHVRELFRQWNPKYVESLKCWMLTAVPGDVWINPYNTPGNVCSPSKVFCHLKY